MSAVASDGDPSEPSEELPKSQDHGAHAPAGHEPGELSDAAEAAAAAGPKRPARGTSRLGLLAMLAGIAACVLCRPSMLPPSLRFSPITFAIAGLVLAFLASVGRLFGSRAKAGLPLLAVLLCLTAIAIAAYQGGARDITSTRHWASGQVEKYRTALNQLQKRVAPANPPTPASRASLPLASQSSPGVVNPQAGPGPVGQTAAPAGPGPAATPGDTSAGVGSGTIFDMRPGAPGSSPGVTGAPAPAAVPPAVGGVPGVPSTPSPLAPGAGASLPPAGGGSGHGPSTSPRVLSAQAALRAAQGKEKAAEDDFRYSYAKANHPEYLAAQAEVAADDKLVEDAKRRSDGFGQPLIDATRQRKEAQEKVARIVNDAMARDPAVASSRKELAAAEESVRQAYEAAK